MAIIERRYIGRFIGEDRAWRIYTGRPNWTFERAQESVDRLNKIAPKKYEYRVRPKEAEMEDQMKPGELTESGKRWEELHRQFALLAEEQYYREYPEHRPAPESHKENRDAD